MLTNWKIIGDEIQDNFKAISQSPYEWAEIKFSDQVKTLFNSLPSYRSFDSTIFRRVNDDANFTILPSQYVLFAIFIKEFAMTLFEYMKVIKSLKEETSTTEIYQIFKNNDRSHRLLAQYDDFEKNYIFDLFSADKEKHWSSKSYLDSNGIRGDVDFFGSVILKLLNIPDTSSGVFGAFVYDLCENPSLYKILENEYFNYLPFIKKTKVRGKFAAAVLRFCFHQDQLKSLSSCIRKNEDSRYVSLELDERKLTSVFRVSKVRLKPDQLIVGSKPRYFDDPIFKIEDDFVYCSTEWTNERETRLDLVSLKNIIESAYLNIELIISEDESFTLRPKILKGYNRVSQSVSSKQKATNKIFFGSPGTGKSYKAKNLTLGSTTISTLFHPEYSYSDFVGSYRPVVGYEVGSIEITTPNGEKSAKPVNYFEFVAGPFVLSLVSAFNNLDQHVFLLIDEINRGECASIFGDIFQLLDRDEFGCSEYGLNLKPELEEYFVKRGIRYDVKGDGKLYLPPNLSIIATMNTSDQSLYPIDAAFKRRWEWISCQIDFEDVQNCFPQNELFLFDGHQKWSWVGLLTSFNNSIVSSNANMEDKQIGPWFIKPLANAEIDFDTFANKFLYFIWHDVYKDEQQTIDAPFAEGIRTFTELQHAIKSGGLRAGFKQRLLESSAITSIPEVQ